MSKEMGAAIEETLLLRERIGTSFESLRQHAEVDSILGDLMERGRKHGISAPLLQAAFIRLTIYQWGRAAAKAAGS